MGIQSRKIKSRKVKVHTTPALRFKTTHMLRLNGGIKSTKQKKMYLEELANDAKSAGVDVTVLALRTEQGLKENKDESKGFLQVHRQKHSLENSAPLQVD